MLMVSDRIMAYHHQCPDMAYRAVLFDFDFTLGDSAEGIIHCANSALRSMGLEERDADAIRASIGLSLKEKYVRITGDTDPVRGEEFERAFIEAADRDMTRMATFYPEALPLLAAVRGTGLKIGIVTTKYRRRITEVLDKYGVPDAVDVIVGGDSVKNPKPAPDGLLLASELLGIPVEEMVYVGDNEVDAKAARSAGMDFIGVLTGITTNDIMCQYPNVGIIGSIGSMYGLLGIRR